MFDRITQNYQPFMFVDNISNLCDIITQRHGRYGFNGTYAINGRYANLEYIKNLPFEVKLVQPKSNFATWGRTRQAYTTCHQERETTIYNSG
jgi:hypothetical protein